MRRGGAVGIGGSDVTQIAMTHTFIESMAKLAPIGAKRTAAFIEKLLREPEAHTFDAEIVRDAYDRSIRSLRVNQDLRAIAQYSGDSLELLFVGHHDDAYDWARAHCFGCDPPYLGRRISIDELPAPTVPGLMGSAPCGSWYCSVGNRQQLRRALDTVGVTHELAY